ncbi:response regulator transcription factor [bacterium]|nr:response regulator transcription factor [bacterium]
MAVVVADDHPLVRVGVRESLEAQGDFVVVGEARTAEETLEAVRDFRPELLILDLEMPGRLPRPPLQMCREIQPDLKVLVLSAHRAPEYLAPLRSFHLNGFVLKDEAPDSLIQAVRVICEGQTWISGEVRQAFADLAESERLVSRVGLTARERRCLC